MEQSQDLTFICFNFVKPFYKYPAQELHLYIFYSHFKYHLINLKRCYTF